MSRRWPAMLLLGLLGCKPEVAREPIGEAPPFHDQILYESTIDATIEHDAMPVLLPVDVRGDAIHVGRFHARMSFARDGSTELDDAEFDGVPIRVPDNDAFMVWHRVRSGSERRIFAARSDQPEHSWPVLDYVREDAISEPIVVGDRVAVVTEHAIAHASIRGGSPELLALSHTPSGLLSSDAGRLVWIARQSGRELVMSTDASFAAAEIEYEQPQHQAKLLGAVLVGGTVVFASVNQASRELIVQRKRADGSLVELLRGVPPGLEMAPVTGHRAELRLLADGTQGWLYMDDQLWWIGADSHALIRGFKAKVESIGADDGLLVWQSDDALHVAGQPSVEFHQPFRRARAIGGDDDDVWLGSTGDEIGRAYGVDGQGVAGLASRSKPAVIVELKQPRVDDGFAPEVVEQIVRAHINFIQNCYRAALVDDPSLAGTIELEFVIDGGGRVAKVEDLTGDGFANHEVSRCVARALRRWTFLEPRDGASVTVRYPISLRPGE